MCDRPVNDDIYVVTRGLWGVYTILCWPAIQWRHHRKFPCIYVESDIARRNHVPAAALYYFRCPRNRGQAGLSFAFCPTLNADSEPSTSRAGRSAFQMCPYSCHTSIHLHLFLLLGSYKHGCEKNLRMLRESTRILSLKYGQYMKSSGSWKAGMRIFLKKTPWNYMWQRPFGVFHPLISIWYFGKKNLPKNLFPCAFSFQLSPHFKKSIQYLSFLGKFTPTGSTQRAVDEA